MSAKEILYRLPDGTIAYLEMHSPERILMDKGLAPDGDVQTFHTQNVLRRIQKYMPMGSGMTIKVTIAQTDIRKPRIVTNTPYARFLFNGKLMVDPVTGVAGFMTPNGWRSRKNVPKVESSRPISYNKSKNPLAGPRWDQHLIAAEGHALSADLQAYINHKK